LQGVCGGARTPGFAGMPADYLRLSWFGALRRRVPGLKASQLSPARPELQVKLRRRGCAVCVMDDHTNASRDWVTSGPVVAAAVGVHLERAMDQPGRPQCADEDLALEVTLETAPFPIVEFEIAAVNRGVDRNSRAPQPHAEQDAVTLDRVWSTRARDSHSRFAREQTLRWLKCARTRRPAEMLRRLWAASAAGDNRGGPAEERGCE
jgi:hypothetical protein